MLHGPFGFDEREEKAGGRVREYGWRMKNSSVWKMRATSHELSGKTSPVHATKKPPHPEGHFAGSGSQHSAHRHKSHYGIQHLICLQ